MSKEKPPIAGELRLRVVSSNDTTSFESGSDLLRTDGRLWSRPIYHLSKYCPTLYEKLWEDRLIPDGLNRTLATLPSRILRYRRSHVLYTLNDTFIVDFSQSKTAFLVITEQGVDSITFFNVFSDYRGICKGRPYTGAYTNHHLSILLYWLFSWTLGSALARFERSTLPDHKGTRTVVLRFLKMVTPVKCVIPLYDGYVCFPTEGELHRRTFTDSVKRRNQVWNLNIDNCKSKVIKRGLQLLWDT